MRRRAIAALAAQAYPLSVAAAVFVVASGLPSSDSDTYWHLASGKWMVEHRELLRADPFSSTVAGRPYGIGEWLGELVLYGAYLAGGWAGVAVLRGLLVAAFAFFVTRIVRRGGASPLASLPLVVAVLAVSAITWSDRPQLWTLALVAVVLDVLLAIRDGHVRLLLVLPPLFLLWADLHAGYPVGLAICAAFALEALALRRPVGPRLVAAVAVAALATLIDPAPFQGTLAHALTPPRYIAEFLPPDVLTPAGALFALIAGAALAAALLRGGGLLDLLLLAPLLWLGLSVQRHMPFFSLVGAAFVAERVPAPRWAMPRLAPGPRAALAAVLVAVALLSVPFAPSRPDERAYPAAALDALHAGGGRLLNEYDWGGYLIWYAPDRPVFVDGRYVPYLDAVLPDFREAVGLGPRWRDILTRYEVREALLRPERPLAVALREDGWTVRAEGQTFVLLVRP